MEEKRLLLLCHHGGWDRLYQAASCAASAATMGWAVDLVFYFAALEKLLDERLDEFTLEPRDPRREKELEDRALEIGSHGPAVLLATARRTGRVRVLACSASAALIGRDPTAIGDHVDAVVGWPTTTSLLERASKVLYL